MNPTTTLCGIRFNITKTLIFLTVPAALLAPAIIGLTKHHNISPASHMDWRADVQQIRSELARLNSEAAKEEHQVWDYFAQQAGVVQAQNRSEAAAGLEAAVGRLVQMKQIGLLIADFAQDKIVGGDRAGSRVDTCSGSFNKALKDSAVRTQALLIKLQQDLTAVNNRHAMKVGEVIESQQGHLPRASFEHLVHLRQTVPLKISVEVGGAAFATTVEIMTVGSTKQSVIKVTRYLAAKLAPQIGKAAFGVGAALADGPLPFGEIVTVGLGLWTVWDVAFLPSAIRSDVKHEYQQASQHQMEALDAQLAAGIQQLSQQTRRAREDLSHQILASLGQ